MSSKKLESFGMRNEYQNAQKSKLIQCECSLGSANFKTKSIQSEQENQGSLNQ